MNFFLHTRLIHLIILFIFFSVDSMAQSKAKLNTSNYSQQVQALSKNKAVQNAFAIIDKLEPTTRKEHIELTEVSAPPFMESARAEYFKKMMEAAGPDKVWIDSIGNVIALRKGKKGLRTVVVDAHLDTVFPEGTDVKVRVKGDTLFAPGIADDTHGLITMLTLLKVLEKTNIETTDDILFIGSVGEEGLGDLRGVKYLIEKSHLKIDAWIEIDGTEISEIVNGGLGVVRYKATIKGPGGHSWSAFGLGNPHHAMAKAVNYFSDEANTFTSTGIKTSFNIGRSGGGTSVNSIPFESWVEVDMRSESQAQLKKIDSIFKESMKRGLNDYNNLLKKEPKLTLQLEQVGYRPSGVTAESTPLVQRAKAAVSLFTTSVVLGIKSTNANVVIAKGIPAITIGAGGKSDHVHSLEEWWINERGSDGTKFALLTLLLEAGME